MILAPHYFLGRGTDAPTFLMIGILPEFFIPDRLVNKG